MPNPGRDHHMASKLHRRASALAAILLAVGACDSLTGSGDQRTLNERVPGSNGIHPGASCAPAPTSLELLGHVEVPERLMDVWGYHDPITNREYALAGFRRGTGDGGLYVVDVTDPEGPSLIGTADAGLAHDVVTWEHYAYTVTGHEDAGREGAIYDLSDPTSPELVGNFPTAHNLFVSDRGYLYAAQPGVVMYDLVPDPTSPEHVWDDSRTGGHDVAVVGDLLLDFHGFDGTFLYDNTDPLNPEFSDAYDGDVRFHHSGWPSGDGQYLFVNDELPANLNQQPDITVFEIASGDVVATYRDTTSTVHNSYELCDRLVVSYYTLGLVLLDASDPTSPALLDSYDTDPTVEGEGFFLGAWGVFPYTRSGNVLVSDVAQGVYVFGLR